MGSVRVCWAPGHPQIPENEAADQAAKKGAAMDPPPSSKHSYASLGRRAKADVMTALQRYWQSSAPQSYQGLWITNFPRSPTELKLPRPFLARILAARTGHGDFAAYHERFNHEDAYLFCRCENPWFQGQTWGEYLGETLSAMLGQLARNRQSPVRDQEVFIVGLYGPYLYIARGFFTAATIARVHTKGCAEGETTELKFTRNYDLR
ncbi:uncharacterized protein KD926_000633 [Aspergillus affinis]|uniref:uncharacterized protein n=1 Tax=Aspergillus affinis TaxID=1070780 RepID=UPI0022FECE5D|nr:uncharacterized protein KD926_000633 [Aspergillus affinis]KAI9037346.1 hypothetical protein KD926_000633 [Aspergillus affinis]